MNCELKTFLVTVLMSCGFMSALVSCSDNDDEGKTFETPAQTDAQGTYSGTFTRMQVGTTDSLTAEGTITITATDTLNRARITYASEGMEELAKTAPIPTNIAHADQGYMFYNKSGDYAILGRISDAGIMSASFTKAVRSGRKTVRYNYVFEGHQP